MIYGFAIIGINPIETSLGDSEVLGVRLVDFLM